MADAEVALPANPDLAAIATEFEALGTAATMLDAEWFHVYTSREYAGWTDDPLMPDDPPSHWFGPRVTRWMREQFGADHSRRQEFLTAGPAVLYDTPGGRDVLRARVDPSLADLVDEIEPAAPTTFRAGSHLAMAGVPMNYGGVQSDLSVMMLRLFDRSGQHIGTAREYRPAVRMSQIFTALALADPRHLDRMAAVARPGRRPGALLFADLEASAPLAKRVPTAQYFAFGRRMMRAVDQCLIDHGGIVGRHAGDGFTGYFLAETSGSESAAARSCIEAAAALRDVLGDVAERSDLDDESLRWRFGLHWGARLYVGLVLTPGRTEVTGLGDDVNDAARIEACATGGLTLASKDLIECLSAADASALDIDLGHTKYTVLAELSTATEKARRDAPVIAVCTL